MKVRSFTFALCLLTVSFVTGLLLAEVDNDGPLSGSGSVTKSRSMMSNPDNCLNQDFQD